MRRFETPLVELVDGPARDLTKDSPAQLGFEPLRGANKLGLVAPGIEEASIFEKVGP